jgi:hypothetical protein
MAPERPKTSWIGLTIVAAIAVLVAFAFSSALHTI